MIQNAGKFQHLEKKIRHLYREVKLGNTQFLRKIELIGEHWSPQIQCRKCKLMPQFQMSCVRN